MRIRSLAVALVAGLAWDAVAAAQSPTCPGCAKPAPAARSTGLSIQPPPVTVTPAPITVQPPPVTIHPPRVDIDVRATVGEARVEQHAAPAPAYAAPAYVAPAYAGVTLDRFDYAPAPRYRYDYAPAPRYRDTYAEPRAVPCPLLGGRGLSHLAAFAAGFGLRSALPGHGLRFRR